MSPALGVARSTVTPIPRSAPCTTSVTRALLLEATGSGRPAAEPAAVSAIVVPTVPAFTFATIANVGAPHTATVPSVHTPVAGA